MSTPCVPVIMTLMASGEHNPGGSWPLGPIVRAARDKAGYSLRKAGELANGMSPTTWETIETGTRKKNGVRVPTRPLASNIIAAANALRLDVNHALELAGYDPSIHNPGFHPSQPGRTPTSQRAIGDLAARLTDRQRAAVVEVIESMLWPNQDQQPAEDGADQPPEAFEIEAHPASRHTSSEPMDPLGGVELLPSAPVRTPAPDPASEEAGQGRRRGD